jgi:hypothetical protein
MTAPALGAKGPLIGLASGMQGGAPVMKKASQKASHIWHTCSRGHKYRGATCSLCWPGKKAPPRVAAARPGRAVAR